jgi:signal transduction histidine kinase
MQLLKNIKEVLRKIQKFGTLQTMPKLLVVLGITLVYIVIFWLLIEPIGPIVSVFLSVPVIVAGLYFGSSVGLLASFIGFALNIYLQTTLGGDTLMQVARSWPGYLAILLIGYFAGYLHDEAVTRKRSIDAVKSRERFIALVNIATKSIMGISNPEEAYYRLVSHLTNLFVADYAHLIRWDDDKERAVLIASTKSLDRDLLPTPLDSEEARIIESALKSGRMMVIKDVQKSNYVINPISFKHLTPQTKSVLVLPLCTSDYQFGVVVLAFNTPYEITPDGSSYVELASNQITLALRTVQQQLEIETQLKEARALAKIARALSESERVGVDSVLQLIVDSAKELIPKAKSVILHLLDDEKKILVPSAVAGYKGKTKGKLNMRLGEGVAGQVMKTGKLITIADVQSDARFLHHATPVKFRSLVVAPIQSHDETIGTISIHSDIANAFDANEVALLETLGTQVSIGIDNANLLETLEQRVQQRTHDLVVLYNLITIISENWRIQDLLELSLVLTLETVKADRGIIYLTDGKETPDLKPVIQRGFGEGFQIEVGKLPNDKLARKVFETHRPFATDNIAEYPAYAKIDGIKCYAGIPIMVRGDMRGVFSLFASVEDSFGAEEMALLTSIADHLGIGIENSILWEQSRENAAIEERNRLARNLHDSVTQLLYSLTLMAGSTKKMLDRDHDLDDVKNSVSRLGDTAHQALKEMRLLLYELRPAVLDSEGLINALRHRVETVEVRLGMKVDLKANELPELSSDVEDALYHIALEALNNIVKHSESKNAKIEFAIKDGNIVMKISDNGKGFETDRPHSGLGLRNMRERGQLLGGDVEVASTPGKGTQVRVKVKVPPISRRVEA